MANPNPEDKIEKISSTEGAKGVSKTEQTEPVERVAPNKEKFDSLVKPVDKSTQAIETQKVAKTEGASLMDEMRNLNSKVNNAAASPETLAQQSKEIMSQMNDLKQKLSTPHLELSGGTQKILENKLHHLDESLQAAMSKAGVEYSSPSQLNVQTDNPIERFLGYLTNAQGQMSGLSEKVAGLGDSISAADMFRIQMSMSTVSVQLEFFSSALNKALESIKTVMQVQV